MRYIRRNGRLDARVIRVSLATALSLSAAPPYAWASSEAWHAHAESVLELLQADTRRALGSLEAGRPRDPASKPDTTAGAADRAAPAGGVPDQLELVALYGTAGRFTAVVHVNGVRKEYRPGATLPYAGGGAAREYRLVRIVDSCVLLKRQNARQTRSACFSPARDAEPLHADRRALVTGEAASLSMPLPAPGIPGGR